MNKHFLTGLLILVCLSSIVNECYAWPDPPVIYISDWYKWVALRDLDEEETESFYAVCSSGGPIVPGGWDWDYPSEAKDVTIHTSNYNSEIEFWFSSTGRYEFEVEGRDEYGQSDSDWAVIYVVEVSMDPESEYICLNDLVEVEISLLPSTLSSGTVTLEATSGEGDIEVYYDSAGTNEVELPVEWDVFRDMVPENVWVKGISASDDVTLRIRYKRYGGSTEDEETADFTVVDVEMELEKVGNTTIETANTYSENTTIRVTAVDADDGETCTWFTGDVSIAEDTSDPSYEEIYTQNGGYLPSSITFSAGDYGVKTFVAKSLAGPKSPDDDYAAPDPAKIITTNYEVYNPTGYLVIEQWVDVVDLGGEGAGNNITDWFEARTEDVFDTHPHQDIVSTVDEYYQFWADDPDDPLGYINFDHDSPSIMYLSPNDNNVRIDTAPSGSYCGHYAEHLHTNLVLHESRHCYQDYLSSVHLGQYDDIPDKPDNDDDQDWLVETVPIGPTNYILDTGDSRDRCTTTDSFSGDSIKDYYWIGGTRSDKDNVIEKDAADYASQHD